MKKYGILFLIGFFLGYWEHQKEKGEETEKVSIAAHNEKMLDAHVLEHPTEEMPRFKNGTNNDLLRIIGANLIYPNEDCLSGVTVLSFTINEKGKVENPYIKRSISPKIDKQLLDIITKFEFVPGRFNSQMVNYDMNLPIRICLQ